MVCNGSITSRLVKKVAIGESLDHGDVRYNFNDHDHDDGDLSKNGIKP